MTALLEEHLDTIDTTEVHWSTSTILAVFFAASLISAVFFGLGYSFGRGGTAKMMAGANEMTTSGSDQSIEPIADRSLPAAMHAASRHAAPISAAHLAAVSNTAKRPAAMPMHANMALPDAAAAHYIVQVGAIGDRRDAQKLVIQLRKRGFHSGIYPGKRDKYLHVQIGPFATPEQANSMRHRLMANGFHAILKHAS